MSMAEALRGLKLDWLSPDKRAPLQIPQPPTVLEEMQELVRMASGSGTIDQQSSTWIAVSSWAAQELLETFVKQESAGDEKAAALRARAAALRELLRLHAREQHMNFEDESPDIP